MARLFRSRERKFLLTFAPWNFRSLELGSHNVCLTVYLCMLALEGITKLKQYEGQNYNLFLKIPKTIHSFPGAKGPVISLRGPKVPGNERARE